MPPPKLIMVYAGYGDTLLLEYQSQNTNTPGYWLIDGGPVTSTPAQGRLGNAEPDKHTFQAYYQFLKQGLRRFCSSDGETIDRLNGIIVTHPHADHMDGIIQLMADWLPMLGDRSTSKLPLRSFEGPVLLNNMFFPGDRNGSVLSRALSERGFRRKNMLMHDTSIPNAMTNASYQQNIRKMVYDPTGKDDDDAGNLVIDDVPEEKTTGRGAELTVDESPVNEASIITTWNDGTNPPIVTTGDTIGIRVLGPVRSLANPSVQPPLGIFKIPHHGSQRNSQIDAKYQVIKGESNKEKKYYGFLGLASWFLSSRPNQPQPRPNPDWIQLAKNDIIANWEGEWINMQPTGGAQRDADGFAASMEKIVNGFWDYIKFHKLHDAGAGAREDLTVEDNLRELTVRLAQRHFEILRCVYGGDDDGAKNARNQNLLKNLKVWLQLRLGEWTLANFKLEEFRKSDLFPSTRRPLIKRSIGGTQVVIDKQCEDLYDRCLLDDPSEHAVYITGMIKFYKEVRATKYAISANGEHRHPSPNTVAALMVSVIEDTDDSRLRQLFVTDGAALKVDHISAIVANLLEQRSNGQPLARGQWRNRIRVYYLDTDYCAPIPSTDDPSEVAGCRELDFDAKDSKPARDLLHKQFTQTSAYDVPRAAEPSTSAFEIFVSFKTVKGRFSLSFDGATQSFRTVDETDMLFHLFPIPVNRPPLPQNPTSYMISGSSVNDLTGYVDYTASNITLRASGRTSEGAVTFYMRNSNGDVLSYKSATELDFQPEGDNAARLSFSRKDGFGPPIPIQAVLELSRTPTPKSSLEHFIEELDPQLDPRSLSLAALGAIIIGPERLWAFISNLPKPLTSAISLPSLLVDYRGTKIDYTESPFGLDVANANIVIAADKLPSITAGTFNFAVVGGTLEIVSKGLELFDIALRFVVELAVGAKKLRGSFVVTSDGVNPVVLDVAAHQTAPSDILSFLGFGTSFSPLPVPLGGGDINLSVALHTAGFTLVQPSVGSTGLLDLSTVYFTISANWKPWEKVLPTHIQPDLTPDLFVTVALVRPKPRSPFAIGLQLDYALDVEPNRAKLLFQMSYWPIKGLQNSYRTSVGFRSDDESELPPASIDDVLAKIAGLSWKQVTDSIPALGSVTKAISITQGSLAIDSAKTVSGFSIQARIQDLVLLSSPSLKVEAAGLIVDYNGTSWNGRFASRFLFADKFNCAAEVVLPSVNTTGRISFQNLDDGLTTGELAKAINPSIDLATVPIIGGSFLAHLRLEQAAIEVAYAEGTHFISSFLVGLNWDPHDIGQLKTSYNQLSISWHKGSPARPIPSIEGSGASEEIAGTGSTWEVNWEGILFTDWHLSAILRRSSLKTTGGESKSVTILSGAIVDSAGRIQSGSLVNSFASTPDGSSDSLWSQTVPSHVTSSFELKQCAVSLALGDDIQTFGVGARATWGKAAEGTGLVIVERLKTSVAAKSKWGFAFAISVSNFRFSDFVTNSSLVQAIDDVLAITRVSALVFNNPEQTEISRLYQLVKNASACGLIPPGTNVLPPEDQDAKTSPKLTTGVAVFALLNFKGAKDGSLTRHLDTIAGSGLASVELMGFFGKGADKTTAIIFSASISSIKLFESVTLEKIKLSYAPVVSSTPDGPVNTFSLSANCRIQFSPQSFWDIESELAITKTNAKLVANLKKLVKLSETFGLAISDVEFRIEYTFSSPSTKGGTDKPKSIITLGAKAQILSIKAEASIEFDNGKPTVLMVNVPSELSVSDLINQIFNTTIPSDILDIKFSNFFMYYAWKTSSLPTSPKNPKTRTYIAGFHAEADTDVYGVGFVLAVDILGGDDRRITISGTKKTPVEVLGVILHGPTSETEGPRFSFSTGKHEECSVAAGLKLFGTEIGSIGLIYNSQNSQFLGKVAVKAQFIPGGQASVSFELAKRNGKYVFRFVELPAAFDELVTAMHIINTIRKLSALDGNPCGAIELAFDQLSTKLRVKVSIPDSQKGISPDKGTEGTSQLNLSITGSWDIKISNHTVSSIGFRPFMATIEIPKSSTLEAFGRSLANSLKLSAEQIVQGLWENRDKLTQVIAIMALKRLGRKALETLLCRGEYTPEPVPGDEPGPGQEPRGADGGGPDGDGAVGATEGPGAAGGGTADAAAAAAAGAEGAGDALMGVVLALFGTVFDQSSTWTPPVRPQGPAGPPPVPPETDVIGQLVYGTVNKNFTRWKDCVDYQTAMTSALACALEYREAISLLRKVLRSKQTVANLGKRAYKDYNQRLDVLLYDFSMMSYLFAEQWLDMTNYEVELRVHSPSSTSRKLDVSWDPLRLKGPMIIAVTVQIEGEKEPRLKLKSFDGATKTTIDIPPFSDSANLAIKVQVSALGAAWGGDPKYAFFSQGKPVYGLIEEVPKGTATLDFNTKFSEFALRNSSSSLTAKGNMPVLLMGSHRYWPMNYVDGRNSIGLVAQSTATLAETRRWIRKGDKSINRISIQSSAVSFIGESGQGVTFTLQELSLPDSLYLRTRVAIRDASSQPTIPRDGPKYDTSVQDVKKYPVVLVGSRTWWPVLYPGSSTIALIGYESNLQYVDSIEWDLDSPGSRRIGRLEHVLDQSKPNNNKVEVYDTNGGRMTFFGFESLLHRM